MKALNLNTEKLYGREDELRKLQLAWKQVISSEESRARRVLIRGYAGIGKTQLVTEFLKTTGEKYEDYQGSATVLIGKFEEHLSISAAPFSALAEAISEWCLETIATWPSEDLVKLRGQILDAVGGGSQTHALLQAIPALRAFLVNPEQEECAPTPISDSLNSAKSMHQLQYQLQMLLQTLATKERPLVLWIDDMQWTDSSSANVLQTILTDTKAKHLLFIGSYRDQSDSGSLSSLSSAGSAPLQETLAQLEHSNSDTTVTYLQLGNLDLPATQHYIADVLLLEPHEVEHLAAAIFAKTHGNIYFTRASLLLLKQRKILTYSLSDYRWEWDLVRLQNEMGVSQNVVDLTLASLQLLPSDVQQALAVASLGFSKSEFDLELLRLLLVAALDGEEKEDDKDEAKGNTSTSAKLRDGLEGAVQHGLLENPIGTDTYRFVHDRIREAAISLWDDAKVNAKANGSIPGKNVCRMRIGKRLLELSSKGDLKNKDNSWMVFAGLDNLNSIEGPIEEVLKKANLSKMEVVQWNLKAGSMAAKKSGFASASKYLQKALMLVATMENRWQMTDHQHNDTGTSSSLYSTCLELYVMAANVDFCLGRSDRALPALQEVIDRAHSERDKLQAYVVLAEGLGRKELHEEALQIDHKAMAILNPSFPKWFLPMHLLRDIKTLKATFQKMTDDEILSLPILPDNDDRVLTMKIFSSMWIRAYLSQHTVTCLLCMTRALRMTLKHGSSAPGGLAFAAYGSLLCGPLAEYTLGVRLGHLSHKILALTQGKEFESRILFTAAAHTDAWVEPLSAVQEKFLQGHRAGQETGDIEFSAFNLQYHNIHAYLMGLPLEPIIEESERLIQFVNKNEVFSVRAIVLPFHQMLLDLAGKTADPMSWVDASESTARNNPKVGRKSKDPSENLKLIWSYFSRGQLAYFFNAPGIANMIWIKLQPLLAGLSSYAAPTINIFMQGLIGAAMFRKTGKRRYRLRAQKAVKEMKSLMEKYNTGLNLLHRYYIMRAEYKATCQKSLSAQGVRKEFDQAISVASKAGFVQDNALAHELCGQHFVDRDDIFWAKHYLTTAYNLYLDWGALAKADHLSKTRSAFLDHNTTKQRASERMSSSKRGPLTLSSRQLDYTVSLEFKQDLDTLTTNEELSADQVSHVTWDS